MTSSSKKAAEQLAKILDDCLKIPGTNIKFGLDPIIGLVPGLGDWITSLLSFFIVISAYRDGVSRWTISRMVGNILVDLVLGALPLIGDAFDIIWKSNRRNLELWDRSTKTHRSGLIDFMFIFSSFILVSCLSGAMIFLVWNGIELLLEFIHANIK